MIEKIGIKESAGLFVQARQKLLDAIAAAPEEAKDQAPKDMTFKEYQEFMEEESRMFMEQFGGDEGMECGESEADLDEVEDDEDEDEDEEEAEPAAKKQKTK